MKIQADIVKYCPDDLHFDQEEGSEWFDAANLKIESTNDLEGNDITFFLVENVLEENP